MESPKPRRASRTCWQSELEELRNRRSTPSFYNPAVPSPADPRGSTTCPVASRRKAKRRRRPGLEPQLLTHRRSSVGIAEDLSSSTSSSLGSSVTSNVVEGGRRTNAEEARAKITSNLVVNSSKLPSGGGPLTGSSQSIRDTGGTSLAQHGCERRFFKEFVSTC